MNSLMFFLDSWLLGGLTYPALTFVITAAMKSTLLVLGTWALTAWTRKKPALMRLWAWRACLVALLSVLLWGVVPLWMEKWRWSIEIEPNRQMQTTLEGAQALDLVSERPREMTYTAIQSPLIAYTAADGPQVPLEAVRTPWMDRIEEHVFHLWWSVALLLLMWRALRSACGHFWLRRQSEAVLNGTEHRLVRGLSSPVVTGWRKAQIWLPTGAVDWPEAKLRAVCLHEMAHHARHDGAWQWLGWLAASVWWWNPLAWFAQSQLKAEAERSADESALAQNISPANYAQVLVEIAAGGDLSAPAAGVAMLGHSGVKNRVKALLSGAGQNGIFGRKTRIALILTSLAAVMAAGVELRHQPLTGEPSEPLSEAEKVLVQRALETLEPQLERLGRVHVKLTESWNLTGKENVSSPRPSMIEAWVDEISRQSRAEYSPRVMRWVSGAAPWSIRHDTEATDGKLGWSLEENSDDVHYRKEARMSFFPTWQQQTSADELLACLKQVHSSGFKKLGMIGMRFHEEKGRAILEREWAGGGQIEHWEIDLEKRGLMLFRRQFPKRPEPFSTEWRVKEWGSLQDGTPYPAHTELRAHWSEGLYTYTRQITSLEVIDGIPPELLVPPQKKASPYVATDGVARHGEWLEARFVHAKTGKPVPEVKVHFEVNRSDRTELISDANGVLRIPLPKEEVKFVLYWGMKPGFVMQRVTWRRYGDPLKLPDVYETKLYPAGKPIGGKIVDATGKPLVGAQVEVTHTGGATRWDVFSDVHDHGNGSVKTNAQGIWSMRGFAEDLSGLSIRVKHPKYKPVSMGYEMASSQPVETLRDDTGRIVLKSEGFVMSGVISDTNGELVRNGTVTLTEDKNGRFDEPNAKTDAAGRFAMLVHKAGKEWFTFEAPGLAPQMVQLDVNAESVKKLVVVTLRPGTVFKAQVVDEAGKPVSGVRMIADRWQEKRTLWFEGVTDAEGRLEWAGAPPDAVKWTLLSQKGDLRDLPLVADGQEHTVVLRPALRFTGTVVDAETGLPLKTFQVTPGDSRRSSTDIYWQDAGTQTFHDGAFTLDSEWMRFEHKLRISAEGYEPHETALFTPKQQTETLMVKLQPRK